MSRPGPGADRRRWALAVTCGVGSWLVAAVLAVIASLSGSQFAAGPAPDPRGSVLFWALTGVFVALPVAALPTLGFGVRRSVAWAIATTVVIAVALTGVLVLNTP